MEMAQFKVGDKVQALSGGPVMTVEGIHDEDQSQTEETISMIDFVVEGTVYVQYYCNKKQKIIHEQYSPELLKIVKE